MREERFAAGCVPRVGAPASQEIRAATPTYGALTWMFGVLTKWATCVGLMGLGRGAQWGY